MPIWFGSTPAASQATIRITPLNKEDLAKAAALIRAGRLVAFPTETVYGLGANALDAAAVARIYEAKGRPPTSPLIVHVDGIDTARSLVTAWPSEAETLARRFWPGPLTLVLPKNERIPDIVTAGLNTVGLRVPAHPIALELIRAAGVPIAAPSANRFTQLSPTTAEHVRAGLENSIDFILDGGPTQVGIESTIVSLAGSIAELLRLGMVSRAEIEALIGPLGARTTVSEGEAHPAPGMHARHYSPATRLILVRDGAVPECGQGAYVTVGKAVIPGVRSVSMPSNPQDYAAVLYAMLHDLDRQGFDWIAVEAPPEEPEWQAVLDRLKRASAR